MEPVKPFLFLVSPVFRQIELSDQCELIYNYNLYLFDFLLFAW